ncbi:MAG: glycine cleavage system aminomethyltransferase GcvT [Gemmatimonadota bacterium]|nr:glycine cleavage system aminomethyltransferase GcvT [Gemmatimonadota bacterium]
MKRTPLYKSHLEAGAKMVPFAGWEMPVSYSGILEEHRAVRSETGLFDVSHMGRFRVRGPGSAELLDSLITGRARALADRRFIYTLLLNERGGVLDDLLVGRNGKDGSFLIVVNAANRQADWDHVSAHLEKYGRAQLTDESDKIAMLALQGPGSRKMLEGLLDVKLDEAPKYYRMEDSRWLDKDILISRTGYTGELGYEIFVESGLAPRLWDELLEAGAVPCGLGARDTLRLEMGYPLYGNELDRDHTPFEAGLSWVVDMEKENFLGKQALVEQKARGGTGLKLCGIEAAARTIPRPGYALLKQGDRVGRLASGGVAPSLGGLGIGTAYLPLGLASPGTELEMKARGRIAPVTVVKTPFYKKGTARD